MATISDFRRNYLIQLNESISSGYSIADLLRFTNDINGNRGLYRVFEELELYPDDDLWPIESLEIEAIIDYFKAAEMIDNGDKVPLSHLAKEIQNRRAILQLRNLEEIQWNGDECIAKINVGLTDKVISRIQDLHDYLHSIKFLDNKGLSVHSLDDWQTAYKFLDSFPVKTISLENALVIIKYIINNKDIQALRFFERFPLIDEEIKFNDISLFFPFASNIQFAPKLISTTKSSYNAVVCKIIDSIVANESGQWIRPWIKRAIRKRPINFVSKKPYKGINTINLWLESDNKNYDSQYWATEKQWKNRGFYIQINEQPSKVFIAFKLNTDRVNDDEDEENQVNQNNVMRWGYRSWNVFNACQLVNYSAEDDRCEPTGLRNDEDVDDFVSNTNAKINFDGNRAYYRYSTDHIQMPDKSRFINTRQETATQGYYSTLLHELVHWSGHEDRCNRRFGVHRGDNDYAFEELVAELGAVFLCADLGIMNVPREVIDDEFGLAESECIQNDGQLENHTAYIKSWVNKLKNDPAYQIARAANISEKAVQFLQELQL